MNPTSKLIRRALLLGVLALGLTTASAADAQRIGRSAPAAQVKAPLKQRAAQFQKDKVGAKVKQKAGNKLVMTVNSKQGKEYAKSMHDTVEVLFSPRASSYGHVYLRIGDRLLDMPGPSGARSQDFASAMKYFSSPVYGFVFEATPHKVAELKVAYDKLMKTRPSFSIAGGGCGSYSCAGFVTSILAEKAPELKVGKSVGAIGTGRRLLSSGAHTGVTLYGRAISEAAGDNFSFEKIE